MEFRNDYNPSLNVAGVIGMKVESGTSLHSEMLQEARKYCNQSGIYMYETIIPKSIAFAKAVAYSNLPAILSSESKNKLVKYGIEHGKKSWVADVNLWCHDQLSHPQLNFLRMFPEQVVLNIKGLGDVLFIHGSPRDDDESIRKTTPEKEIVPMVRYVDEEIIVCGHTHIQFDRLWQENVS